MARLDAAARFTPALTVLTTFANREHSQPTDATTDVVRSVSDREAVEAGIRSEFSMDRNKPIQSYVNVVMMVLQTQSRGECQSNDITRPQAATILGGKVIAEPNDRNICASVRCCFFPKIWPPDCFILRERKQANVFTFYRIRENPATKL